MRHIFNCFLPVCLELVGHTCTVQVTMALTCIVCGGTTDFGQMAMNHSDSVFVPFSLILILTSTVGK